MFGSIKTPEGARVIGSVESTGGPSLVSTLSRQWASRPLEEKFLSLHELRDKLIQRYETARSFNINSRRLEARAVDGDYRGLQFLNSDNGDTLNSTNWSFSQMAQLAKAPAGYLASLPSPVAAACINWGLARRNVEDVKLLTHGANERQVMTAATGPNYGRVHDADLIAWLCNTFGDGRTGDFVMPGEFGDSFESIPVERQREQSTIYGSDRNVFVFLADTKNRVEVKNRRDGKSGSLARGVMVWNSETGSETIGAAHMLFDFVCFNRNIWGVEGFREVKIRHTSKAPERWLEEVAPAIEALAESDQFKRIDTVIQAAQEKRVDDAAKFLSRQFEPAQVKAMIQAFEEDEGGRPIETIWDANTAATAYARGIKWQDQRVAIERKAGLILDLVAA